ncbi:MAG: type III pantothenate kinase, partial [Bacillota bacterium]
MSAILAIDAGNTRIKWGVHEGGRWSMRGAVPTEDASRLAAEWREAPRGLRAIASNVAGPGVEARIREACERVAAPLTMAHSRREQLGVASDYDAAQLGPDRWAALVAAHHAERGHKLVVNA